MKYFYLVGIFFLALLSSCSTPLNDNGSLVIAALDVGDSDALVIHLPTNQTILIDGGSGPLDAAVVRGYLSSHNITHLDYVIATHFDHNHVGAINNLLSDTRYTFGGVFMPNDPRLDQDIEDIREVLHLRHLPFDYLHSDDVIIDSDFLSLKVLWPPMEFVSEDADQFSLVLRLQYHSQVFLFMGDSELANEQVMIEKYGTQLDADWIKIGKHGEADSSSSEFLHLVSPQYAVISRGADDYSIAVIQTLMSLGTTTYQTQTGGSILTASDGTTLSMTLFDVIVQD